MRLASVKRGNRVECNVRGFRFDATVLNTSCGAIPGKPVLVEPHHPNISFRHLAAHQIKAVLPELEPVQEVLL